MLRSAASKVVWVGRATVFMVGLAVILALLLGLASTALGANGQPFILGENNAASALTRLIGNADGSTMQVVNNDAGDNDSALSLSVQAGEAPMRVNTSAKVTNLNADKVDGRSAPLLMNVAANGDLGSNDTVASVTHTANSGVYDFEFPNRAVSGCVYQATLVNGPDGGEIAVYPNDAVANRLTVITTRNGLDFNARYDRQFHLVLWC
jgi:hypothetical protein